MQWGCDKSRSLVFVPEYSADVTFQKADTEQIATAATRSKTAFCHSPIFRPIFNDPISEAAVITTIGYIGEDGRINKGVFSFDGLNVRIFKENNIWVFDFK